MKPERTADGRFTCTALAVENELAVHSQRRGGDCKNVDIREQELTSINALGGLDLNFKLRKPSFPDSQPKGARFLSTIFQQSEALQNELLDFELLLFRELYRAPLT